MYEAPVSKLWGFYALAPTQATGDPRRMASHDAGDYSVRMTVFGHVAFAYVASRYRTPSRHVAVLVILGALLPDMIDKPLRLLGVYPWGRTIGHSIFTWALLVGFVLLIDLLLYRLPGSKWVLFGAMTHLVADLTDDIVSGFQFAGFALTSWGFWPLANPDDLYWIVTPLGGFDPGLTTYEATFLVWAVLFLFSPMAVAATCFRGTRSSATTTDERFEALE